MRVASKIVTVAGTLIAILTLVLALHLWWVQRLAEVTASLPISIFRVGAAQLELDRATHELIEFSRKAAISEGYETGLRSIQLAFQRELRTLALLELAPAERDAVTRVQIGWRSYRALPPLTVSEAEPPEAEPTALKLHVGRLEELRSRLDELANATSLHLGARRRAAQRSVSLTKRMAWATVSGVLLLTISLLWWTIRSLHRPLRRLTAGTRDVAAGRFALHLDSSSGDELAEVAEGFNRMVRRLRELDALKRDFLSHVSHELNTPLVAMRETNQLLLDGLAGPLSNEQRRMLELNREGSERLSNMIRKVLDLSRLEAGAMEYDFSTVDLTALVQQAVDEFEAAAKEREIRVELSLPGADVLVNGDHDRLLQVAENLVSNALKFAPERTVVRVALEAPKPASAVHFRRSRDAGRATLTVSDEGPGIPTADREAIFEKFHRGSRKGSRGFGLGLAICREIVSAHGGRLWVRDNTPQGSVFGVELAALAQVSALRAASGSTA